MITNRGGKRLSVKEELIFLLLCYSDEDLMFLLGKKVTFLSDVSLAKGIRRLLFDSITHINVVDRTINPTYGWIEATISNFGAFSK